jgi:hypothetical protein
MSTAQELLNTHGIVLDSYAPGRYYATCPECSRDRKKPGHKNAECLGVTIDAKGARWGCNHCNWTGPEKGGGTRKRDEWPSYIYRDRDGVIRFRKVRKPLPGGEKTFFLQHADGNGGWGKGVKGVDTTILYRADEVAEAIEDDREICVAEGEKDADSLWRIDIPATCNVHGASEPGKKPKWTAAHSALFSTTTIHRDICTPTSLASSRSARPSACAGSI